MASGIVKSAAFAGLGLLVALAGCTRTTDLNQGGLAPTRSAAPLRPAPLTPVSGGALQPVNPTAPPPSTLDNLQPENYISPTAAKEDAAKVAAGADAGAVVVAAASSKPVTRQALVGAWTVSTGGGHCQIFLALTKWSGGYRAASRKCSAVAISDVQAWDVKGKQIVLVDSSGAIAATLYRSANERYDGSTKSGGSISFSR